MNQKYGLRVAKPVSFWLKAINVDFKQLFSTFNKALINSATWNYIGVFNNIADSLKAFEMKKNPEQIAWLLIYRSIAKAITSLIDDSMGLIREATRGFRFLANNVEFNDKNLSQIANTINYAVDAREIFIEESFFDNPKTFPVIHDLKTTLSEWLAGFGLNPTIANSVSERLPSYFVFALNEEWRKNSQNYKIIIQEFPTPFTKAAIREQEWNLYYSFLQKKLDEPLFGEPYSLRQIFVPLRSYSEEKNRVIKRSIKDVPQDYSQWQEANQRIEYEIKRTVFYLEEKLNMWIDDPNINESIYFISGGPGYGKSTVAKMFAVKQIENNKRKVLFIPLSRFKLVDSNENLSDALNTFVLEDEFFSSGDLLDNLKGEPQLLLIFDGLDELTMQGKFGKKYAEQFIEMVQRKVEVSNRNYPRLKILISGRDISIQTIENRISNLKVIHLLPYFVKDQNMIINFLNEENEDLTGQIKYDDEKFLLKVDQRNKWWKNYGSFTGKNFEALPADLDTDNLREITSLPLLNFLVARIYKDGKINFTNENNINAIYENILESLYEREGIWADTQHGILKHIKHKEDFFKIFEEIAYIGWKQGNLKKVTVEDIENHYLESNLQNFLADFKTMTNDGILSLLIAFYFRKSDFRDQNLKETFEFTHKSFAEYLVAKKIISCVKIISQNVKINKEYPNEGWNTIQALIYWIRSFGANGLDDYLLQYINDEITLQHQKSNQQVIEWQKVFDGLFTYVLHYGMPMNFLNEKLPSFREVINQAKNSEELMLAVMSGCQNATSIKSDINVSREVRNEWLLWNRRGIANNLFSVVLKSKL